MRSHRRSPAVIIRTGLARVAWLCALSLPLVAAAQEAAGAPVLVLHSYHAGFTWTDKEQRGVRDGFQAVGAKVDLHVEYLDAKRHPGRAVRDALEALLRTKHAGVRFPVVITTDNAALEFALDVRPRLFPGAAVVYCGLTG